MSNSFVLCIISLLAISGIATALECYNCQYIKIGDVESGDKDCKDNPGKTITCLPMGGLEHCGKFTASGAGGEVIYRDCYVWHTPNQDDCLDDYEMTIGGNRFTGRGCVCDSNKCNSASSVKILTFLSILSIALAVITKIY